MRILLLKYLLGWYRKKLKAGGGVGMASLILHLDYILNSLEINEEESGG